MKKTIVVATVAALAAAGVAAQAGPKVKDASARCVVTNAQTLAANEYARVYGVDAGYRGNAFLTKIYACRYSTGRKVYLGTTRVQDDENVSGTPVRYIRDLSLSDESSDPPGVAYVDTNCTRSPCTLTVVVRSLGSGAVVRRLKAGSPFDQVELSQPTDQDGFALAWLESSAGGSCDDGCRVHLVKNSGDRVLDEGADIDSDLFGELHDDRPGIIHSLGTNTFIWKRGATIKSASYND